MSDSRRFFLFLYTCTVLSASLCVLSAFKYSEVTPFDGISISRNKPTSNEVHESTIQRSLLTCDSLDDLMRGEWVEAAWWRPSSCYPLTYYSESARYVLKTSKLLFVGNKANLYHSHMCASILESSTVLSQDCRTWAPILSSPSPSAALERFQEVMESLREHGTRVLVLAFDPPVSSYQQDEEFGKSFITSLEVLCSQIAPRRIPTHHPC